MAPSSEQPAWLKAISSPLWICLLVAILARVWLIVHTQGVIAGDEAIVGIQSEHILRGEHPVYYYAQPYLGSFQAYIIALIFLITGPQVWAMRIEPILVSLVIVTITWRFSTALAQAARLSPRDKRLFTIIATLIAACAPLYDVVEEMRVTGGYVEAFAVMLWLLFCALRLTQRWQEQASRRELAVRWGGIGFLIGFGLWIDPLVIYADVTIALWIGGYVLVELVKRRQQTGPRSPISLLKEAYLSLCALPALLVGFAPGLIWGARHGWTNVTYLYHNGGPSSSHSLHMMARVSGVYATCLAPRALGGALPTQPDVTNANPHVVTLGLIVAGGSLLITGVCSGLSFFSPHTALARVRQLTLLPLLFLLCVSVIFCTASIASGALVSGCGPWDLVGRYTVPLVLTLPYIVAAACLIPAMILQDQSQGRDQDSEGPHPLHRQVSMRTMSSPLLALQVLVAVTLIAYFFAQGIAYIQASPQYTFQATGCVAEYPTNLGPLISYMQSANIQHVWAVGWVADPITFETDSAILATQPNGRIPANSDILLHADRPSMLVLARQNDAYPAYLRVLDDNHITYHTERFYASPGIDILLITPLNRTVSPLDPVFTSFFREVFGQCLKR
ncbi:MAG TPA: hypothetical protein VKQ30_26295 [Ktedonobacterales bacterium]|nr:hypothetical protein [Ktedonobacterales bacterium]